MLETMSGESSAAAENTNPDVLKNTTSNVKLISLLESSRQTTANEPRKQ